MKLRRRQEVPGGQADLQALKNWVDLEQEEKDQERGQVEIGGKAPPAR